MPSTAPVSSAPLQAAQTNSGGGPRTGHSPELILHNSYYQIQPPQVRPPLPFHGRTTSGTRKSGAAFFALPKSCRSRANLSHSNHLGINLFFELAEQVVEQAQTGVCMFQCAFGPFEAVGGIGAGQG